MPQLSLINDRHTRPHDGVRVPLVWDPDADGGRGAHVAMVQVLREGSWWTLTVICMAGVKMDLLSTLVTDVYAAYAWGERRDVARAAAGVERAMRAHVREAEY